MTWRVRVSSKAESYYLRLDNATRARVKKELEVLSEFDNPADHQDVKPLTGKLKGFYRLRVGKYRVIFSLLKETRTVAVVAIAPRGDVY